jgi:hypothetical protein
MANTIVSKVVVENTREAVIHWTLSSDGTNETKTVIYDSSVIATALGITDPLTCNLLEVHALACVASTARASLLFDATTATLACGLSNGANPIHWDLSHSGGIPNTGTTGRTGDIVITTTGLASGDTITIRLRVRTS